jgi:hypothetical protein
MSTVENTTLAHPYPEKNRDESPILGDLMAEIDDFLAEEVVSDVAAFADPDRVDTLPHVPVGYADPDPTGMAAEEEGIACPRCEGSGYVDWEDIHRLHMEHR